MRQNNTAPQGQIASYDLPDSGAASPHMQEEAQRLWIDTASKSGVDLSGFDPTSSLAQRIAWAMSLGLHIGVILTRFSTKMQGSTEDQIRVNIEFAARNHIYCPQELLCVDEGVKGKKEQRPALTRAKLILKRRLGTVLLVYKLSRLFRKAHKAVRFIEEEIVEESLRAIAVTQNIDTADRKSWRLLVGMHGAMDEELISAIADHVREGQVGIFLKGWATGALPVGYKAVPVPGAPLTRRGLPRTTVVVDEEAAKFIREHFALIAGGMTLKDGWLKWRRDGGPVDKRAPNGEMGYYAYHRMLSRADYIGVKEFGRKRNQWSSKADAIQQLDQAPEEIKTLRCEELRIVDDVTFWKVQKILQENEIGPRQRRVDREHHLWDLVIGVFKCPHCFDADGKPQRFHMTGAKGQYMHCPHPECPAPAMVDRREAVDAICRDLSNRLMADTDLVQRILDSFATLGDEDIDELAGQLDSAERKLRQVKQKINDIEELLGSGNDEDRTRRKAQIRAAEQERSGLELEVLELKRRGGPGPRGGDPITQKQVEDCLLDLVVLLNDAAAGKLGPDVVGKAVQVFSNLVGSAIVVHADRRPGRSRWVIKGRYTPDLHSPLKSQLGVGTGFATKDTGDASTTPAEVWLRRPPLVDQMADEVHRLYHEENLGFRLINQRMEAKYGQKIGSGNVCAAWRRWHEVRGLLLPPPRTNTGRPRKAG